MFELVVIYKIKFRQVTGKKNSNETQLYSADIHAINDPIVCFGCLRRVTFAICRSSVIEKSPVVCVLIVTVC